MKAAELQWTSTIVPSICVCICTFKRPEMLRRLLDCLGKQETGGKLAFSVVVVDNDKEGSAAPVAMEFVGHARFSIQYAVEPCQNIALARNRACGLAQGDFLAWIDDDEFPSEKWLISMLEACQRLGVAGVLGPVLSDFQQGTPQWVVKGGFYDRPRHATGFRLGWEEARTGNVLVRRKVIEEMGAEPFQAEFHNGGEDKDFFERAMEKRHVFAWCDEGEVFETIAASRCTRGVMIRRALLRGANSLKHSSVRATCVAKSLVAVPVYLLVLPIMLVLGQHLFMKFLIKLCDHAGRLLAVLNLNPVSERAS